MYDIKIGTHITAYDKNTAYDSTVQHTIEKVKAAATEELITGGKNEDSFQLSSDTTEKNITYANYAMYKALSKTPLFSEYAEQADSTSPISFFTALENLRNSAADNDAENITTNFDDILSLLKQLASE